MDKIRSCVEEVVRPLAECPPHHTYVYNALCPILRELPEYKLLQSEVRRLAAQLDGKNAELERMRHDLDELSSGGEEMVLEVRDHQEQTNTQTAGDGERGNGKPWERDGTSQCSSSDGDSAPTFPPGTIKRIMFEVQAETEVTEDSGFGEAGKGEREAKGSDAETEEDEPMSEDEEVEEMIIQGASYYCSTTTIYECAPNGDVGVEVGVFRNKLPVFHMDDSSDLDVDFI